MRKLLTITLLLASLFVVSGCKETKQEQPITEELPVVPAGVNVKVNQVGYLPQAEKIAFIIGAGATSSEFKLVEQQTGKAVFTGKLSEPVHDASSGDEVRTADFSEWNKEGTYSIQADGAGASHSFTIATHVYEKSWVDAGRSFTLHRAGIELDDPITGLKHAAAHLQDKQAYMYGEDEFHKKDEPIDASGGWYDAGDFSKYTPTAAVSAANLLMAYEWNASKFTAGQWQLPSNLRAVDGFAAVPDVLQEAKVELDWLLKMQRQDGAVYLKVAGRQWPGYIKPEEDLSDRYVYGLSTYGTGQYAGVMALAARVFEPFDGEYAKRLLESAARAHDYLTKHPDTQFIAQEGQDTGSGPYRKDSDLEERFWASAELLRTTGDVKYAAEIDKYASLLANDQLEASWMNTAIWGQWAYYNSKAADSAKREVVKAALLANAERLMNIVRKDGYRVLLTADEYKWGSNRAIAAKAQVLLMANAIQPAESYYNAAADQLHYILGRNAAGTSYLTGSGTQMPKKPHSRLMAATGTYIPGVLVGGANGEGGDAVIDTFMRNAAEPVPPAKAYVDDMESFATNEYAIDYTAALFFLLSCLQP